MNEICYDMVKTAICRWNNYKTTGGNIQQIENYAEVIIQNKIITYINSRQENLTYTQISPLSKREWGYLNAFCHHESVSSEYVLHVSISESSIMYPSDAMVI